MPSSTYRAWASRPLLRVRGTVNRARQSVTRQKLIEGENEKLVVDEIMPRRDCVYFFFMLILCSRVLYCVHLCPRLPPNVIKHCSILMHNDPLAELPITATRNS